MACVGNITVLDGHPLRLRKRLSLISNVAAVPLILNSPLLLPLSIPTRLFTVLFSNTKELTAALSIRMNVLIPSVKVLLRIVMLPIVFSARMSKLSPPSPLMSDTYTDSYLILSKLTVLLLS